MAIASSRFYAAALLVSSLTLPAAAQTARIAHLSHGGNLETLDAAGDNFGLPSHKFQLDSVCLISDSMAVEYGQWFRVSPDDKWAWKEIRPVTFRTRLERRKQLRLYEAQVPRVKILKHDTIVPADAPKPQAPALKKQKPKRKKAAFVPAMPAPPQHPGLWLGTALLLSLAGAGWLLSGPDQRPRATPARA